MIGLGGHCLYNQTDGAPANPTQSYIMELVPVPVPLKIGVLEDTRNHTLHGILRMQSCFRGHQARSHVKELRRGIFAIQSFVRGEKARKEYAILLQKHRAAAVIQKQIKARVARKTFVNSRDATIIIQSVIRGWLVRKCSGDVGLLISTRSKILLPVPQGSLGSLPPLVFKFGSRRRRWSLRSIDFVF